MMAQRVVTAIVLAAVVLAVVLLLPPSWAVALMAVLVLAGAWEWAAFAGIRGWRGRAAYVGATALGMGVAWWLTADVIPLTALLWASVVWWAVALIWVTSAPALVTPTLAAICGVVVLVPAWLALARLYLAGPSGPQLVLFVLVIVWAADIGAYFIGRALGRVKLAPRVSPGKTWEGVAGGLIAALLVGVLGTRWFDVPTVAFLVLCVGAAVASVVGDLTESMFKRHVGLKDSGHALPGHGGVLDRIDSVTAAAPLFVLGLGSMRMLGS